MEKVFKKRFKAKDVKKRTFKKNKKRMWWTAFEPRSSYIIIG